MSFLNKLHTAPFTKAFYGSPIIPNSLYFELFSEFQDWIQPNGSTGTAGKKLTKEEK